MRDRLRLPRRLRLGAIILTLAGAASAQRAPPATPPAPPPTAPPSPEAPAPSVPAPPDVRDPMLVPVPAAGRTVATWEEALALVRSRSTDLKIAYDEVLKAEAQTRIALAAALTSVNGGVTATHNFLVNEGTPSVVTNPDGTQSLQTATTPPRNLATGSIQVIQPLLNLQAWDQIGIARENEKVLRLSVEDRKRTIALSVANTIVGVVTAERVAELNRSGLRQALERLDLTRRKQRLGAATGLDVVRAQADVETARGTLVTGDESLRQARESLGLALGIPEQVGVVPGVQLDGLEKSAVAACRVAPNIDARPDVAAAAQSVTVAERNEKNVWYQFVPTVNAQSTLGTTTVNTGFAPNTTWNIQAILQIPIWEGGARYGALHQARALADEAQQSLESARRAATVQVAAARRGVQVAEDARRVAVDAQKYAAEIDRLTRAAYIEGTVTSLDLVTSAAALRLADISVAQKELALVQARVLAVMSLATCPW